MRFKITGLQSVLNKLNKVQIGFEPALEHSMNRLLEDVRDQAMKNLRDRLTGTTYSRGYYSNRMPLTDNLDAWEVEKVGVSSGYYQWILKNISEHAAPVETGSRTPIKPKGNWLYLGGNTVVKEVRGQEPKHFLGDALYQHDKWTKNLTRYMKARINSLLR